jgi:hypothetical protein
MMSMDVGGKTDRHLPVRGVAWRGVAWRGVVCVWRGVAWRGGGNWLLCVRY